MKRPQISIVPVGGSLSELRLSQVHFVVRLPLRLCTIHSVTTVVFRFIDIVAFVRTDLVVKGVSQSE